MKHENFVKQLMAAGVPRNRANVLAYECRLQHRSYYEYLGKFLTELSLHEYRARKHLLRLGQAVPADVRKRLANYVRPYHVILFTNNPYIKPLRSKCLDGLRADFMAIDELHQWPKENPSLGATKDEFQCKRLGRWVGIDLANGPDFTAGGGQA